MKPRRTWPLRFLIAALLLIVFTGAYLAIIHKGTHPVDSGGSGASVPHH